MPRLLTASELRQAGVRLVMPVDAPIFLSPLEPENPRRLQRLPFDSTEHCVSWLNLRGAANCPVFAYEPPPWMLLQIRDLDEKQSTKGVYARVAVGVPLRLLVWEAQDHATPTPAALEGCDAGSKS
jgi:hypothetical protein